MPHTVKSVKRSDGLTPPPAGVLAANVRSAPGIAHTERSVTWSGDLAPPPAAVLGLKLLGPPGVAVTDSAVVMHHTITKVSESLGASVTAVKVNNPPDPA